MGCTIEESQHDGGTYEKTLNGTTGYSEEVYDFEEGVVRLGVDDQIYISGTVIFQLKKK